MGLGKLDPEFFQMIQYFLLYVTNSAFSCNIS